MIILRQQMRSKPERTDDVFAALSAIVPGAQATPGVISLDIARDLLDPDAFVATGIYEDGAALERQESAPEVHTAMAMFSESLIAPPERTIYDASVDPSSSEACRNREMGVQPAARERSCLRHLGTKQRRRQDSR